MITKMTKYTFLLLSNDTEDFLREIQELGVLDITRSRKPVDATSGKLYKDAETLRKEIDTIERCDYSRDEEHRSLCAKLSAAEEAHAEKLHWGDLDSAKVNALREAGCQLHFYTVPVKKFNPAWAEQYALAEIDRGEKDVRFVIFDQSSEGANNFQLPETSVAVESIEELAAKVSALKASVARREEAMRARREEIPMLENLHAQKAQEL